MAEKEDTEVKTDDTSKDTSTTTTSGTNSTTDGDIKVGDYGIFSDAIMTVDTLKSEIDAHNTIITESGTKLNNESVFMGPICDSCVEGFSKVGTRISANTEQLGKFHTFFVDASANYQSGDKTASSLIIGSGNTQASDLMALGDRANNGDKEAQKEWLDKMAAIVKPYCDKYGFPDSVVLAQLIQESGWSKSGSWLNDNNNVLNVNSEMFGSGDYKVAKDGTVNENASIPRWASNPKHASGSVSGGAYFESPRVDSMRAYDCVEDCVEDYLALMVGYRPYLNGSDVATAIDGVQHYAEDASYADNLRYAIDSYNLTQYDV